MCSRIHDTFKFEFERFPVPCSHKLLCSGDKYQLFFHKARANDVQRSPAAMDTWRGIRGAVVLLVARQREGNEPKRVEMKLDFATLCFSMWRSRDTHAV